MAFKYKSGSGDVIEFDASSPYFADPDAFRSYQWSYLIANGAVSRFSRDSREISVPVHISAESQREGAELFRRLIGAFDHDIAMKTPGVIHIDGYESTAFAIAGEMSTTETHLLYEIEISVTFLFERPEWVREVGHYFQSVSDVSGVGADFPHDFLFDFTTAARSGVDNESSVPSDVRITIYGPATNPEISIGGNTYGVCVDVVDGGRVVIDGRDRTKICLYDAYGNAVNAFHRRLRGVQGSGEYVFEKVKPGYNSVSWDGSFAFEVVIYDERSIPPCSI